MTAATREKQQRASDPACSAWVSANAGSGKTKVLTDRVIRLLLSGANPARILCLTFTKAAAANMAIRIFDRLGRWVNLDDKALVQDILELENAIPDVKRLQRARRLFARAVETPGGLKIETIHGFCERILHLAPFEANVPSRFITLDDMRHQELLKQATARVIRDASSGLFPNLTNALDYVVEENGGHGLPGILAEALKSRSFLSSCQSEQDFIQALYTLQKALNVSGMTKEAIECAILEDGEHFSRWPDLILELQKGSITDHDCAKTFENACQITDPSQKVDAYLKVFFTDKHQPRKDGFVTKNIDPLLKERLLIERDRVIGWVEKRRAFVNFLHTKALLTLSLAVYQHMEAIKAQLGALDFDDLISKTLDVLSGKDGPWVLYKLDRGIDHVLVDEAQDTNPQQWQILNMIVEDFFSGEGITPQSQNRTLFVVGDIKQSIYGFQGAAPKEFETSRRFYIDRSQKALKQFENIQLTVSFRSSPAVLKAVDAVFGKPVHFQGLSFEDASIGTIHESARSHAKGIVEIWEVQASAKSEAENAWTLPVDAIEHSNPANLVAERIANALKVWTTTGDAAGRIWRPGDILILVRKRSTAFRAVIRALKEAGLPVAGADRLNISAHIAVQDLIIIGRVSLQPDDDLTLATALKTPFINFTEEDLLRIAQPRSDHESLYQALIRCADAGDEAAQQGLSNLLNWRDLARANGPFGFYTTLLGPLNGRRTLVSRLGFEAGDAIDEFLAQAHNFEMSETPSLNMFLARFGNSEHVIKRDLDVGRDDIRVMTVHGAKGLEASVVILIDGCDKPGDTCKLFTCQTDNYPIPVWPVSKDQDCPKTRNLRADVQQKALEEHNRLLYVAMTRARDRLVVASYQSGKSEKIPDDAWSSMIRRSLGENLTPFEASYGGVLHWQDDTLSQENDHIYKIAASAQPAPIWLNLAVAEEPDQSVHVQASHLKTYSDHSKASNQMRVRGVLIHALLEQLPLYPSDVWQSKADAYLTVRAPFMSEKQRYKLFCDAKNVLVHPDCGFLFQEGAQAEVPLAGQIEIEGNLKIMNGRIDRLHVFEKEVLFADFKTGAMSADTIPQTYFDQMMVYKKLLQAVHPDKKIRPFLIWTSGPHVMEL